MLRCINCYLSVDRMLRHVVSSLQYSLQSLLASWISSQQLPPDAVICQECFLRLNQHCTNGNMDAERELGHTHVCLGCGRSVLQKRRRVRSHTFEASDPIIVTILSWDNMHFELTSRDAYVCHLCWMRATRQLAQSVRVQPDTNEHAEVELQPVEPEQLIVPQQAIPVPPPPPHPLEQQNEDLQAGGGNEIKVFCPKCNAEVSHTAKGIQEQITFNMHQRCSYFMCKNKSNTKAMFRFPLDRRRLLVWLERCGNMFITQLHPNQLRNRFICIDHFDDKYIRNRHGRRTRIDKQAIPKPYCFLPSMLEQEPSTISKRECSPISKRECSPISKRECSPRRKPEQSPVPGLFDLEVLLPIKVYRNRKAPVDPIDDFQWSTLQESKEANQEYDMPKYISFKALSDQTKIVIAKVYHYFEQEYEELKKSFDGLEQTPLSKFRQRTALATGVSETTVVQILQEEARRKAAAREEPSPKENRARKRPWETDSSSEEDSDSNEDGDDEPSSAAHEEETLVVKEEPTEEPPENCNDEPEIYVEMPEVKDEPGVSGANNVLVDPISLDFKTEPQNEEATSSNDTLIKRDTKRYRGRKTKRITESPPTASAQPSASASSTASAPHTATAPSTQSTPPTQSAPPSPNAPSTPPRRQLVLLDDGDIKMEQSEEGFS